VLNLLPFGTRVTVLEVGHGHHPDRAFSIQIVKGNEVYDNDGNETKDGDKKSLILQGYWIKVQVGEQTGYVFDGYLSRLRPCKINQDNCSYKIDSCFLEHNKLIGHALKEERDDVSFYQYEQFIFEGGIVVQYDVTEKGMFAEYYLPGSYSLEEGFLIFDALFRGGRDTDFDVYESSNNYLEIHYGICRLEIYCINGSLLLVEICHC